MTTTIRRRAVAALASSGLAVGALVALAVPAGAASFTVTPGHSIQAVIDAAPPGSTIKVKPGTYRENLTIAKNNIKLQATPGRTVLRPGAHATGPCVFEGPFGGPPEVNGICVLGDVDFSTFTVRSAVKGVHVSGFTVRNFPNQGIFVIGGLDTTVQDNVLVDNGEYGVFANRSSGTLIAGNVASGSGEAGVYVGDSPNANAVVEGNTMFDNQYGLFVRSASSGSIVGNDSHDNCLGIFFLQAPNPDTDWVATGNQVNHNDKVCGGGGQSPPLSGAGIVVVGGHRITIQANTVNDNAPGGPTFASGGIVLVAGASNNVIVSNTAHGNVPADLIDQSAASNAFSGNDCDTSIPPGLCGHTVTTDPSTTTPPGV